METAADDVAIEQILPEAQAQTCVRIAAECLMPNRRIRPCAGFRKRCGQEDEGLGTACRHCREESVGNTTRARVSPSESAARLTPSSALQGVTQHE